MRPDLHAVKRAASAALRARPGVAGVGVGDDCIKVYIDRAEARSAVPLWFDGVRVEVVLLHPDPAEHVTLLQANVFLPDRGSFAVDDLWLADDSGPWPVNLVLDDAIATMRAWGAEAGVWYRILVEIRWGARARLLRMEPEAEALAREAAARQAGSGRGPPTYPPRG